jgi:branched-chain amino acid transport system permease protein
VCASTFWRKVREYGVTWFYCLGLMPTLLLRQYELSPLIGVFAGMAAAVVLAAFVGWVTFRLKGAYFAIGTLAIITLMHYLVLHFRDLTGGSQGLSVPFRGHDPLYLQFSSNLGYFYILLVMAVVITWIMHRFDRSQFGWWFRCVANGCAGKRNLDREPALAVELLTQPPAAGVGGR